MRPLKDVLFLLDVESLVFPHKGNNCTEESAPIVAVAKTHLEVHFETPGLGQTFSPKVVTFQWNSLVN